DPIPVKRPPVNSGENKYRRKGELFRIEPGPSHIKRFGHFVIMSKNFDKTLGWYREMLGFRCIRGDKSGLNHLSYEAADIDDVMVGNEHLQKTGYQHMWGIGRHLIG